MTAPAGVDLGRPLAQSGKEEKRRVQLIQPRRRAASAA
jgi:hypothetical protein